MARITVAGTDAVLMSVYRTLNLRGRSPTKSIADSLKTYLTAGSLAQLRERIIANG